MGVVDDLHRAREAYERRDWLSAYRTLSDLDESELTAGDFTALATTAYLLGRRNDCVQASQRAYQVNAEQGELLAAARSALWLAMVLFEGGEAAIAGGWMERARRLLDEVEGDVVDRGYLLQLLAYGHIIRGEFAPAAATVAQVTDYGRRFHDPDLLAVGLSFQGRLEIYSGRVADGLRVLDEAMVGVLTGEVSPVFSGLVYCSAIEACQEVSDFGRAGEWTHALNTWCDAQPGLVAFTGQCAVHRALPGESHDARLGVTPGAEGVRPLAGSAEVRDLLTVFDRRAVHQPGEHRRDLAGQHRDRRLVEHPQPVGNPPGVDLEPSLEGQPDGQQVRVVEPSPVVDDLRDSGRARRELAPDDVAVGQQLEQVTAIDHVALDLVEQSSRPLHPL